MNKWMLASLSLVLAGATALPAQAQDQRRWGGESSGQPGEIGTSDAERAQRGDGRQERVDVRQQPAERGRGMPREERYEGRAWQGGSRPGELRELGAAQVVQQARQDRQDRGYDRGYDRRDDRRGDGERFR